MVNRLIVILLLVPSFLISGEFTASVSRTKINSGESITLNLTLKETSAQGAPFLDILKHSFSIVSSHNMFNTLVINGQTSWSTSWKLTLIPLKDGSVIIPSISIDTTDGLLSTQPITIKVEKGTSTPQTTAPETDTDQLFVTTEVSQKRPYKNEPFFYSARILSNTDLRDIQMPKFTIENAIVEQSGEPQVIQKVVNGIQMVMVEFNFLITPIKEGQLKIPSVTIQGVIPVKRTTKYGSLIDDDFNLFSMAHGFDRLKPFSLTTEATVLDVQPPMAGMMPWIPAQSLKIEEIWNESQHLQAGEPFTRGIKIVAEGIKSNQLPSLNDMQKNDPQFKIYADKPELKDDIQIGSIKSIRQEHVTLIPQQSGTLTLPELSIVWWDVKKNEKVITKIPAKTIQVLPAPTPLEPSIQGPSATPTSQPVVMERDPILYALIGGLTIVVIIAIGWGITLQRKLGRLSAPPKEIQRKEKETLYSPSKESKPKAQDKSEKLPDLNPT